MFLKDWTNPAFPFAFSGVTKIKQYFGKEKKLSEIEQELAKNSTYTLHKERKKINNFNPFFIYHKHQQWQMDICFLPEYKENEQNRYLLCLLEVFSRKLFISVIQSKNVKTVFEAFLKLRKEIISSPSQIVVDKGSEFKNKKFIEYCKQENISLRFSHGLSKAAHVERAQRSLQNIIYKMMEYHQRRDIFRLLKEALEIYNNRINRITGFSPNDAYQDENEGAVLSNLEKYYSSALTKRKNPKFKVGQFVRLGVVKKVFNRGYHPQFTEEIFIIKKVLTNLPQPRYIVQSSDTKEVISGTFYERELTLSEHTEFKVEKILSKRRRKGKVEFLVKWMGYPESQNSWIEETQIRKY